MQLHGSHSAAILQRLSKITDTLQKSLEGTFTEGLRTNNLQNLTQCLRTYSLIDKKREVELLFRKDVVAPFMRRVGTLFSSSLSSVSFFAKNEQFAFMYLSRL